MDICEAYELSEWTKSFLKELDKNFKIVEEQADANKIVLFFESEKGKDGLPVIKTNGGSELYGEYLIAFDAEKNKVYFRYQPGGSDDGILANSFVGITADGKASFKNPKNMFEIMKIGKEWNDDFKNKLLILNDYPKEDRYGRPNYFLIFRFDVYWDFNQNDTFDTFKKEFPMSMNTLLSQDMRDILEKLSKFRVPGEYL